MSKTTAGFALAMALVASVAFAQAPAGPPAGAPGAGRGGRGPQVVSPEVGADKTVTLRYLAPNATSVVASGELDGKDHPLTKGENGVWSVTIGPLAPDIYTYAFRIDGPAPAGVVALDPRNVNTKYGYGGFGPVSVVEVPGDGPAFYDVKPVPHGQVSIRPYVSKTLGVSRTVWVYTPPNYDKGSNFPVLYLLHGAGDIESGWTMIGRANNILDNLIADGKAKPMVVVMPLGHAIQSFWAGPAKNAVTPAGAPAAGPAAAGQMAGLQPFSKDLLDDVMPLIESTYKVSKKADDRAIAGLSMGGGQTVNIAFNRPELFRYVGLMSPAVNAGMEQQYAVFKDPTKVNQQFKLLWMSVGKDDTLVGAGDKAFEDALTKNNVKHTFHFVEGRHEWTVWRNHLNELAPLLFK